MNLFFSKVMPIALFACLVSLPISAANQTSTLDNEQITEAQILMLFENIQKAANAKDYDLLEQYYTGDAVLDVTTHFQGKVDHQVETRDEWFEKSKMAMSMVQNYSVSFGKVIILEIKGSTARVQGSSKESMDMMYQHFEGQSSGVSEVKLVNGQAKIASSKIIFHMTMSAMEQ